MTEERGRRRFLSQHFHRSKGCECQHACNSNVNCYFINMAAEMSLAFLPNVKSATAIRTAASPPRVLWNRQRFFGRVALLLLLSSSIGSSLGLPRWQRRKGQTAAAAVRSLLVASSPTPTRQNHIIFNGKCGPASSNLSSDRCDRQR